MKKAVYIFLICLSSGILFATNEPIQPFLDSLQNQESSDNTPPGTDMVNQAETTEILENPILEQDEQESFDIATPEKTPEQMFDIPQITENEVINEEIPEEAISESIDYVKIDLPYTEHYLIDYHRNQYLTNFGKQRLSEIMSRASVYRPHIRQTLAEEEIPISLEFLPVIESDFKTSAVSRSGATGIWQFMENSIAGLLEKNEWLDERHDPWLSTEAAAHKLKYNYSILKDWELALAAYNMGLGGLQRAINNAGSDDFWYLAENGYIPNQTKNYVPKFIAVADLVTNAEYYELDIPPYNAASSISFKEIQVDKQINLEVLASLTNIEYSTYQFLNPAFEYAITPPRDYMLRIPSESEVIILDAIEKQDSTSFLESHRVVQGDTLWSLSRKYNTTVDILCEINNRTPNSILSIGTILFLPILK